MEKGQKLSKEWQEENAEGTEYVRLQKKKKAAQLQATFRAMDQDGSGTIEVAELRQLVTQAFPDHSQKVQDQFYETLLKEIDADGDGSLSYLEFAGEGDQAERILRLIEMADTGSKIEDAFAKIDTDGSGQIDATELLVLLKECFPRASDAVLEEYKVNIMNECDKDNSGSVELEEFLKSSYMETIAAALTKDESRGMMAKKGVMDIFTELDADGSGVLDVGEIEELLRRCFPLAGVTQREKYLRAILTDCDRDHSGSVTLDEFSRSEYVEVLAAGLYEDLERKEREEAAKRPKKVPKRKTAGYQGGLGTRCAALSPRKAEKASLQEVVGKSEERLAKLKNRLPGVDRMEADGFKPSGGNVSGDFLMEKAEDVVDDAPANTSPWVDAQVLFDDAAEAYSRDGDYLKAGQAYVRSSDCFGKLGRPIESADSLCKAAQEFRQVDADAAVDCLNEAIDIYDDHERMKQVSRLYKTIGEILEQTEEWDDALEFFDTAADHFAADNNLPAQVYCLRKMAQMNALASHYPEAVALYERLADMTMEDSISGSPQLGRLEVRDFYMKAVLCRLAATDNKVGVDRLAGVEAAQRAFVRYTDLDLEGFNTGQEYFVSKKMCAQALSQDVKGMADTIADFKNWSESRGRDGVKMDAWVVTIMQRIFDQLQDWLERAGQGGM